MTPDCPTGDDLRAMLDDRLAADREAAVLAHVEVCPTCQLALETLTAGDLPSVARLAADRVTPSFPADRARDGPRARPDRVGPYRVEKELGRGGMGVVYLGTHARLRRTAAVKVIRGGAWATPEEVARFRAEAEAVAAVAHPNVVQVYEAGEQDLLAWIALEYVPGGTLRGHLGGHPLPPRPAAELAAGLARGVAAAHAAGVVHRDIKPANVLLAPGDGKTPVPKLTDFGLARHLADAGLTATGAVLGTPQYMAPEQAAGNGPAVGPPADVYALGAVLYEMLTGRPPFDAADPRAVLDQLARLDPVPVRRLQPGVPVDLQTICHKCLEKDPARRYPTAAALADDLGRFLDDRPITARPVGRAEKLWRLCRRNPIPAGLAALLAVTVAGGVAGVGWKWREAAAERDKTADAERDTAAERDAAVAARAAARRQTALAQLDKGVAAAETGRVGEGVVWMAEALTAAPPDDPDLDRVIRSNLAGWLPHAPRARAVVPLRGRVEPAALTLDGRALLVRTAEGRLQLQDLEPGAGPPADAGRMAERAAAVTADGRYVLVRTEEQPGGVRGLAGWDTGSRRLTGPGYGTEVAVRAAAAPAGPTCAVALADGRLVLFDLATSRPVLDPLRHPHPDDRVTALAFAPDGKSVLTWTTGPSGPMAHAWDPATGLRSPARYAGPSPVRHAAFSPDGGRLVTAADDRAAQLWDTRTATAVGPLLAVGGSLRGIEFSPDGRYAVLLTDNGSAQWWDVYRGELVAAPTVGPVSWLALRRDTSGLVTFDAAADPAVWVWDLPQALARPARHPVRRQDGPAEQGPPRTAADRRLTAAVTGGHGAPPRAWDLRTHHPAAVPLGLLGRGVSAVAASPDGRWLAAATLDPDPSGTEVFVWEAATGRPTGRLPHVNWVWAMGFTPDGRALVTGGYDRGVHVWDPATGRRLGKPVPVRGIVVGLAVGPDGRSVALGLNAGNRLTGPALLDLGPDPTAPAVREVWADPAGTTAEVVRFTPDGKHLVGYYQGELHAAYYRGELHRRDASTGRASGPAIRVHRVTSVAVSDDGRDALVGSSDGTARMWDLETGRPSGPPLAHPSAVNACGVFSSRGLGVTGCADGSARVWDLRTGRAVGPPITHGPPVTRVALSPDGRSVLSVAADGSARTWPIPDPLPGDPDRVRQAVTYRTALALDPGQRVAPLTAAAWAALPAADLPDGAPTGAAWHSVRVRDAEADGAWPVAAYHLDHALATELTPDDRAELSARRARCESSAGRFGGAATWYDRAAASWSPERLAGWYHQRATESGAAGRWEAAAWYLDRLAVLRPDNGEVLAARAEVRNRLGDADGWATDVNRAAAVGAAEPADLRRWADRAGAKARWELAAELFERAGAGGGLPIELWYRAAVARLKSRDSAGYALICKRVEAAVRDDWPADRLNNAAWLLALGPGGTADTARISRLLIPLADKADSPVLVHTYANTVGGLLVRAGQFNEVVRWVERGIAAGGTTLPADAALLALAHAKLGDGVRAKARLDEARAGLKRLPANAPWPARAELELLITEAEAAVGRAAGPQGNTGPG